MTIDNYKLLSQSKKNSRCWPVFVPQIVGISDVGPVAVWKKDRDGFLSGHFFKNALAF